MTSGRKHQIIIGLAAGLLLLSGCKQADEASPAATTEATTQTVTETAMTAEDRTPLFGSFQAITIEGEEVTEKIFGRSGLNMVNIWGTYCGPCVREMPDLALLNEEYGGADFQLTGIIVDVWDAGNTIATDMIEATGADYTHILVSQDLIDNYLAQVRAVPTTVFLDQEGHLIGKPYLGSRTKEQWKEIIIDLLEETAG